MSRVPSLLIWFAVMLGWRPVRWIPAGTLALDGPSELSLSRYHSITVHSRARPPPSLPTVVVRRSKHEAAHNVFAQGTASLPSIVCRSHELLFVDTVPLLHDHTATATPRPPRPRR